MKYHELELSKNRKTKRVGRGISAGQGKTAGRGTKGQGARTGAKAKPGFAGGQNPLMQALPKPPGFTSHRAKAHNVYTGQLDALKAKVVDAQVLAEAGLIASAFDRVKLLNKGDVKTAVTVKLSGASQAAIAKLQEAGGSFEKVAKLQRQSAKKTEK